MQQQLVQLQQQVKKFSDILRHTKFEQCYGQEAEILNVIGEPEPRIQKRCAIGVIMTEFFGVDYNKDDIYKKTKAREKLNKILAQHNIDQWAIAELNDYDRLTFPQIAFVLESKGL